MRTIIAICLVFASGCSTSRTPNHLPMPASQPVTTCAAASISLEIPENQKWPKDLRVGVVCQAPPAPPKFALVVAVTASELANQRQLASERARQRREEHVPPAALPPHAQPILSHEC